MKKLIAGLLFLTLSGCAFGYRGYDYPNRDVCRYHYGLQNVYYFNHEVQYVCRDGYVFNFYRSY